MEKIFFSVVYEYSSMNRVQRLPNYKYEKEFIFTRIPFNDIVIKLPPTEPHKTIEFKHPVYCPESNSFTVRNRETFGVDYHRRYNEEIEYINKQNAIFEEAGWTATKIEW